MSDYEARMPFLDHIAELRRRFIIVLASVLLFALVLYYFTPTIIDVLVLPIKQFLPSDGKLTVLSALGGFSIRFKVALFCGIVISTPIISWQVLAFVLPALTRQEKRWVVPTVCALIVLFLLGMVFCYLVILKAAFGWLTAQTGEFASLLPNAEDFLRIIMLLEIGFGFAFELPLFVFYLAILHIVTYKTFRKQWRYIYLVLMVFCAIVTPDASPITMILMFIAIVVLYESSLFAARIAIVSKDGKAALGWSRDEYASQDV